MDISQRIGNIFSKPEYASFRSNVTGYKVSTNEVELTINGEKKYISLDRLEQGIDLNAALNNTNQVVQEPVVPQNQVTATVSQPQVQENVTVEQSKEETKQPTEAELNNITLNDIKTLVELKNKETLDRILKEVAVTADGNVDINSILGTVSNNLINVVTNSTNENKPVSTELYKYDKVGNLIVPEEVASMPVNKDTNIENGFNNLLVYVEVAKLYGVNYTPEQVQVIKQNFINTINPTLNSQSDLNNAETPVPQENPTPDVSATENSKIKTLTPPNEAKAGFADIFILAVIVLVYAAIIVNLVMKLK